MSSNPNSNTSPPPPPTLSGPAPPGTVLPKVLPFVNGTSSPMQSSYQSGVNASLAQNSRNIALSGGKLYKNKRGGATSTSTYTVPQFNMIYNPQNGPGQTPNNIIQSTLGTMGQNTAYSQYDSCVGQPAGCQGSLPPSPSTTSTTTSSSTSSKQQGGTRVCTSGQINCWGCQSGGRRKGRKKSKRMKKSKRIKKTFRMKKRNKTKKFFK